MKFLWTELSGGPKNTFPHHSFCLEKLLSIRVGHPAPTLFRIATAVSPEKPLCFLYYCFHGPLFPLSSKQPFFCILIWRTSYLGEVNSVRNEMLALEHVPLLAWLCYSWKSTWTVCHNRTGGCGMEMLCLGKVIMV